MKIAILGSRGIPATYGGFETFAEEISTRLVERGHEVTVYCCLGYNKTNVEFYKGVRLINLPTINSKYLEKPIYTTLSLFHVLFEKIDIVLICGIVATFFSFIPRLNGKKVIINVDGIESNKEKWNTIVRLLLKISEFCAAFMPNEIVSDSRVIRDYYLKKYKKWSTFIPYGAYISKSSNSGAIKKFGLEKGRYILYVSRLEPENNAHLLINAFERLNTDLKLAIVGDSPYSKNYVKLLKSTKDPRIQFLGYVYGEDYNALSCNAYLYVHGNEAGGTNPALLAAMAFGNCVLAINVPYNLEVIGDAAITFSKKEGDLEKKLQYLIDKPEITENYKRKAVDRVRKHYTWDKVVQDYERLFYSIWRQLKNG